MAIGSHGFGACALAEKTKRHRDQVFAERSVFTRERTRTDISEAIALDPDARAIHFRAAHFCAQLAFLQLIRADASFAKVGLAAGKNRGPSQSLNGVPVEYMRKGLHQLAIARVIMTYQKDLPGVSDRRSVSA